MAKQSVRELGRALPDRIRLLSRLIARKPPRFTSEWASSIEQAFTHYTRTSTVNLFQRVNECLIELDWPFPAYLDLKGELQRIARENKPKRWKWIWNIETSWRGPSLPLLVVAAGMTPAKGLDKNPLDEGMTGLFRRNDAEVFRALRQASILQPKLQIIKEVELAYRRRMWAACISTTVPLLDFAMRAYFQTEKLNVSLQVLRDAFFNEAKLRPKDLMPGIAIWDGHVDPEKGNTFAKSLNEDLRLPGIYLSSFFEFADRYYGWYSSADKTPRTALNRHAIMHCSSEYWAEPNAVRILTFLDLTLRVEPVLKVLIRGEESL
jgi:hypothetical protein